MSFVSINKEDSPQLHSVSVAKKFPQPNPFEIINIWMNQFEMILHGGITLNF